MHSKLFRGKWLFWLSLFLVNGAGLFAQTNVQLWNEYLLNVPFAKTFNVENGFTYSTVIGQPKWRAYDYSATLEWSANKYLDLIAQTVLSYTRQTETNNTFEIRPVLGTRIYLTPNQRIQTRILLRMEQRNFQNLESKTWEQSYRPRIRAEVIYPLNKSSYTDDGQWYAISDVELLYKTEKVAERFANYFRWRLGAGYRLSYHTRLELIYMLQQSKNTLENNGESSDQIIRIRLKHYIRKSNPSRVSGVGN